MDGKLKLVLYNLMLLCAVSVLVVRFILHENVIATIILVVLCCLQFLIWKLEKNNK